MVPMYHAIMNCTKFLFISFLFFSFEIRCNSANIVRQQNYEPLLSILYICKLLNTNDHKYARHFIKLTKVNHIKTRIKFLKLQDCSALKHITPNVYIM